jgi:hypothetical protein
MDPRRGESIERYFSTSIGRANVEEDEGFNWEIRNL